VAGGGLGALAEQSLTRDADDGGLDFEGAGVEVN
jgi:hypothetical protein